MENKKLTNVIAIIGFIVSILSVFTFGFPAAVGLTLSIIGLIISKKYKKPFKGLSIAGIIISSICFMAFWVIAIIYLNSPSIPGDYVSHLPSNNEKTLNYVRVKDFSEMTKEEVETWCSENNMICEYDSDYSDEVPVDGYIRQSIVGNSVVSEYSTITITYSLGHKKTPEEEENEYKASCSNLDYREVLRNPSSYSYQKSYWFGKVRQVIGSGKYMIYVNCSENRFSAGGYLCDDAMYVEYDGDLNLIEDDVVHMWGTMASSSYTYTTVMGASRTIPHLYAEYIQLN